MRAANVRPARGATVSWWTGLALSASLGTAAAADLPTECDPKSPFVTIAKTHSAVVDPVTWDRHPAWELAFRFRVLPDGSPDVTKTGFVRIISPGVDGGRESDVLEKITTDAFAGYRFCVPEKTNAYDPWFAALRFARTDSGEYYVQSFVPIYRAREVNDRHQGKVGVKIVFGTDGRPRKATIESPSGDNLIDRRALDTVVRDVLVSKDGAPFLHDVVFTQNYNFVIQ